MARLQITTIENLIEQLDAVEQKGDYNDQIMAAIVNHTEDKVALVITSDNITDLANAATGFLRLAVDAAGNCECENCQLALRRCRKALRIWGDSIPGNVLPFKR